MRLNAFSIGFSVGFQPTWRLETWLPPGNARGFEPTAGLSSLMEKVFYLRFTLALEAFAREGVIEAPPKVENGARYELKTHSLAL